MNINIDRDIDMDRNINMDMVNIGYNNSFSNIFFKFDYRYSLHM